MAENPQSETFDTKNIPWQKVPNHQSIYANNSGIASSSHDIQLRLAQLTAFEGKPINQEVATIFMAPGQAKATALLLLRAVLDYEDERKIVFPVPEHLGKTLTDLTEGTRGAKGAKK
jgi:hypothetical protein